MAKNPNLTILREGSWGDIEQQKDFSWRVTIFDKAGSSTIQASVLIDGTELGDIAAQVGVEFDIGMESKLETGENIAPEEANDIIQDFTYTAILKDYGADNKFLIEEIPEGYNPSIFYCSCDSSCTEDEGIHPCATMLNYAKLPNDKYLINWPIGGNDYYSNMIPLDKPQRDSVYKKAKDKTLRFIYFIQHELGFKNLGLAMDEFPSEDGLPLIPYFREARRIKGKVRFSLYHIQKPYDYHLYRTNIASGDYPIDHHHKMNPKVPQLAFFPVPSFGLPGGVILPESIENFLVADKSASVSNIVNGSTRLQPVILQTGQAAGALAAFAVLNELKPSKVSIREWQDVLINSNVFIQPFFDVGLDDPAFGAIQRIGSTGILRGKGVPYKWANQTWFDPDSTVSKLDLSHNLSGYGFDFGFSGDGDELTVTEALQFLAENKNEENISGFVRDAVDAWYNQLGLINFKPQRSITKKELAVLVDHFLDPFSKYEIDWEGNVVK
jgi:hypothetical protein